MHHFASLLGKQAQALEGSTAPRPTAGTRGSSGGAPGRHDCPGKRRRRASRQHTSQQHETQQQTPRSLLRTACGEGSARRTRRRAKTLLALAASPCRCCPSAGASDEKRRGRQLLCRPDGQGRGSARTSEHDGSGERARVREPSAQCAATGAARARRQVGGGRHLVDEPGPPLSVARPDAFAVRAETRDGVPHVVRGLHAVGRELVCGQGDLGTHVVRFEDATGRRPARQSVPARHTVQCHAGHPGGRRGGRQAGRARDAHVVRVAARRRDAPQL